MSKTRAAGRRVADFLLRGDAGLTAPGGLLANWAFLIRFTLASRAHPIG